MKATVEILRDGRIVLVATLGTTTTIGRDPDNGIVLADSRVSRRHARVTVGEGGPVLEDLGSVQGTHMRGARVARTVLASGDEAHIGPFVLRFRMESPGDDRSAGAAAAGVGSGSTRSGGPARGGPGRTPDSTMSGEPPPVDAMTLLRSLSAIMVATAVSDLKVVLETLLDRTMRLVGMSRGYLVLAHGSQLSPIAASSGISAAASEDISHTVCTRVLRERKLVLLSGPDELLAEPSALSLARPGLKTVLGLPLVDGDEVLGVLYLESDRAAPGQARPGLDVLAEVSSLGGRALRLAMERRQIVEDREKWRWLASMADDFPDLPLTSQSARMRELLKDLPRVASEDVSVLIQGESGTGKEVLARTIHQLSPRATSPFVAVNCAAIPRDLVEAELFGHEAGAFTGATQPRPGRFELAQGGTLLLDEIGDLPLELQGKLLRLLETRMFERLGSRKSIPLDIRLLCATHRDLTVAASRREFREDLFYRINVVMMTLPPLRERPEDIDALAGEILRRTNRTFRRRLLGVTPEGLDALRAYSWPGNVRELKNVIERAFVLEAGDRISVSSLPFATAAHPVAERIPAAPATAQDTSFPRLGEFVRGQEREYILLVLDHVGQSVTRAAQILGLTRPALHKKMRALGLRTAEERRNRLDARHGLKS